MATALRLLPQLTCSNTGADKGSRGSWSHWLDPCTCWSGVTLLTINLSDYHWERKKELGDQQPVPLTVAPLGDMSAEVSYLLGAIQFTRDLSEFSFLFRAYGTTIPFHCNAVDHDKTEADRGRQRRSGHWTCVCLIPLSPWKYHTSTM